MDIDILVLDITLVAGIEKVSCLLSNEFQNMDNNVRIISVCKSNQLPAFKLNDNIEVIYMTSLSLVEFNSFNIFKKFFILLKLFNEIEFSSVVLSQSVNINIIVNIINIISFNKRIKKLVIAEHCQYYAHSYFVRLLRLISYKYSKSTIVTLTNNDLNIFKQRLKSSNIICIANPVLINNDYKKKELISKKLVSIGRFEDVKGFDRMIISIAPFFKSHPDWTLYMFGVGELLDDCKKLVLKLGLDLNIKFKGFSSDINKELSDATFLLSSSYTEAFPMTFIESMAMGVPVIAPDCPVGPGEIISSGYNGMLIENKDTLDYIKAIDSCILNIDTYLQLSENARNFSLSYDLLYISNVWIDVFSNKNRDINE